MTSTDPNKLPDDVRHKLLLIRTAVIAGDINEANHWLYSIACPSFTCFDPWAALEGRQCACGPHSLETRLDLPSIEELESVLSPGKTEVTK
jgi:hypothetical protein